MTSHYLSASCSLTPFSQAARSFLYDTGQVATLSNPLDIQVYYVKETVDAIGFAIPEPFIPGDPMPDAVNTVFVSSAAVPDFTFRILAHEFCHMLTKRGHYGGSLLPDYGTDSPEHKARHALMATPPHRLVFDTIGGSKRIYSVEETFMQGTQHLLSPP